MGGREPGAGSPSFWVSKAALVGSVTAASLVLTQRGLLPRLAGRSPQGRLRPHSLPAGVWGGGSGWYVLVEPESWRGDAGVKGGMRGNALQGAEAGCARGYHRISGSAWAKWVSQGLGCLLAHAAERGHDESRTG